MNTTFGQRLKRRLEKTFMTFISSAGVTWGVVTWLVYAGKIPCTFTEYTIFTLGILAIKSFKQKTPELTGTGG
jgi:hypothetical protein